MMKISIISILFFFINCTTNKNEKITNNENKKIMENKIYAINYDLFMPYKIYINGYELESDEELVGQSSGYIVLNPFIAKSGKQTVLLELKNPSNDFENIKMLKNFNLELYFTDNIKNIDGITFLKKINFENQEFINTGTFYELIFFAEVPYNSKKIDLTNSSNLAQINSNLLLDKVIAFYAKYGNIINNGDAEAYKKLFYNAHQREIISMHYTDEEAKEMIDKLSDRIIQSKGKLQPLKDYTMYIHPNGKVVELRTKEGKSPLYSRSDDKIRRFAVYLHIPANSHELEIY